MVAVVGEVMEPAVGLQERRCRRHTLEYKRPYKDADGKPNDTRSVFSAEVFEISSES